jgi:Flp pilus assembly protein TadG
MSTQSQFARMLRTVPRRSKGQTFVIISLASIALLGAASLGTDIAVLYYNWAQLQKAADAAVLAGANYLPDQQDKAKSTAIAYATNNGIKAAEIVSTTFPDSNSIMMQVQRNVPYHFARVLGFTTAAVNVGAKATVPGAPTTVNANTPGSVPLGGDSGGANGGVCAAIGACDLLPIGLDSGTAYTDGAQITLQQGQLGPGNWDLLALGTPGGSTLRTNIANGYSSMVSVNDWVTTEPGKKVGPVDQGFQDRLNQAATLYPTETYSTHSLVNPRVLVLPVVNWTGQNGRKQVQVTGFATVWLDSYSGGKVTVHFIQQAVAHSYGDPSKPSTFGARGTPFLAPCGGGKPC